VSLPALPATSGALDGDRVYVSLRDEGTVALDRETGATVWTNPIGAVHPLLLTERTVIGIASDEVIAFDGNNGAATWRFPLPFNSIGAGVTSGGLVVVPLENETLMAVRVGGARPAWSARLNGLAEPFSLAADATAVYVARPGGRITALALATGDVTWEHQLDGTLSNPATGRDRVFVGSTSNAFFAIDASSGRREWVWGPNMIGGDVIGAAVDDDVVYVVSLDNMLRAVNRGNGNQRWKEAVPTRPTSPPRAFGGTVLTFGVNPAIAAFDARTGATLGTYVIPPNPGAATLPVPKGPPLIDPDLHPFRVAVVVITADGRAIGLRPTGMMFREVPPTSLTALPGRALSREQPPSTLKPVTP
jgi:outer membrane protein assembly factor BamB